MGRHRTALQAGLSTVELLVTLFVAVLFLGAGYNLYTFVIKDSGTTRADAKATATANEYLDRFRSPSDTCTASTPFPRQPVVVDGLSNVYVTVAITCPDSGATAISKVTVTVEYNNPTKTMEIVNYSGPNTDGSDDYHIGWTFPDATPYTPTFYWPAVANATNYDVQYSVNGAPFTTVTPSGQTTTSWTYNDAALLYRDYTVTVQVTARNGATVIGTSKSAKAKVPKWTDCSLQNGWVAYDESNFGNFTFTKTKEGVVFLSGLVKDGNTADYTTICTLPLGFRPTHAMLFRNQNGAGTGSPSHIYILPDGRVQTISLTTNSWYSVANVSFLAAGSTAANALAPLTLLNSWTRYDATYDTLRSAVDGAGRVHMQGLVRAGTNSVGAAIASIPVAQRSPRYLHLTTDTSGTGGVYTLDQVYHLDNPMSYQSIQFMYYPTTAGTWTNMTLYNLWVEYDSTYRPQYTKAPDGVVTLRGLVKSGTTGCVINVTNLPVGYRPSRIQISQGYQASYETMSVYIYPNGDVKICADANSYNALDNISFPADQ